MIMSIDIKTWLRLSLSSAKTMRAYPCAECRPKAGIQWVRAQSISTKRKANPGKAKADKLHGTAKQCNGQ